MNTRVALMIAVVLVSLAAAFAYVTGRLSLIPGPEGLDVRFYGFDPYGSACWSSECVYTVNSTVIDPPYYWVDRSPYTASFGKRTDAYYCVFNKANAQVHACVATDSVELKVAIGTPTLEYSERAFTYWVNESGKAVKVVAWEDVYRVPVEIVAVPKTGTYHIHLSALVPYDGVEQLYYGGAAKDWTLWFVAGTVVWNRAFTDPDNPSVHSVNAFNVPLAVYVEDSHLVGWESRKFPLSAPDQNTVPSDARNFAVTSADASGRRIALYTEPSEVADVVNYVSPADVENIVEGDPRPDTRLKSVVFFPITLNQFGAYYKFDYGGDLWSGYHAYAYLWYPARQIYLRVIYMRFGIFVYSTNTDTKAVPTWSEEQPYSASSGFTQPGIHFLPKLDLNLLAWVAIGFGLLLILLFFTVKARPSVKVGLK